MSLINKIKTAVVVLDKPGDVFRYETVIVIDDPNLGLHNIALTCGDKKYIPVKGDKIYFEPGCVVPRFKVKELCKKYGVRLVKAYTPGCIQFTSTKSFSDLFRGATGYAFDKQQVLDTLKKYFSNHEDLIKAIHDSELNYVFLNYSARNTIENHSNVDFDWDFDACPNLIFKDDISYAKYMSIINNNNCYDESAIQSLINNGTVMNEEEYDSVCKMLESTSLDDHKMALEIMANCDYEQSCVYLLRLFMNYGSVIYNAPNRKHVNFKALLTFFNISRIDKVDLDDVFDSLLKRKLLNKANLDKLMPLVIQEMKEQSRLNHFSIKEVQYDDDVAKGLEENILDTNKDTDIVLDDEEEINPKL